MTYSPPNTLQAYLPTSIFLPKDKSEERIVLTDMYAAIANATNIKDIGIYDVVEIINGQQFFNEDNIQRPRSAYRKVFSIGAIAAGDTSTTAHNISGITTFTRMYGVAEVSSGGTTYWRPIPFSSITNVNLQIQIQCSSADLIVVNGAAAPDIVSAIVVLEFLKN